MPTLDAATTRLDRLIRAAAKVQNPYVRDMGAFLAKHRVGLLVFYTCLESSQHTLKRLSRSQRKWVPSIKRWAVPITSNAAEHVFRCLRRYTNQMDHFGTEDATQRFFDLFAFYYDVRILRAGKRAGNSLLASAHVNVKACPEPVEGSSSARMILTRYWVFRLPPSPSRWLKRQREKVTHQARHAGRFDRMHSVQVAR